MGLAVIKVKTIGELFTDPPEPSHANGEVQ
jgi:hypothetical protein